MTFEPTPQQLRAIQAPLGPVLVMAGPGAGKTYCLISRIQHLIHELEIPPRRILAVTFTNKAAEEIATRLREVRGYAAEDVTRGTLHAICFKVLRDYAQRCGLRPGFGVADQEYQLGVLKRLRVPEKRRAQVLTLFGLYRMQGRTLTERGSELLARYQERLRARNLADFDDLVVLTERLLRTDATAAAQLRARWDYVLVDEFQDLSPLQYAVVRELAAGHRNLFGVGDDEQAIFSWAGSDPHIIHRFRDDFGLTHPIILDRNCRCSEQIFDVAKRLIACNPRLFEKRIEATRESPYDVTVEGFGTEEDEAAWLIEDMQRDREDTGISWGDIAVLYRSHRLGRYLEERLVSAGIPCRLAQGHALTDDKIVGWVVASLQVIRAPEDPVRLGILAQHALPPALRQEVAKLFVKGKDLVTNLRTFAAARPRGDADSRRVWRLIYHLENLRGMARSHRTLAGLVDELLTRPIGLGRNPLEEHHHDLSDPAAYPGAAFLAGQLDRAVASGSAIRVEPCGGMEIPLTAMLRGAGVSNARPIGEDEQQPGTGDLVLRAGDGSHGWPLRLFKALQLMQTRGLKSDFDDFVAFDIETSDFDIETCEIVEIAAVRVRQRVIVERFHSLVACCRSISARATDVHGYTDLDLVGAPPLAEVWPRFRAFVGSDLLVAHNGQEFDVPVLRRVCQGLGGLEDLVFYDTLPLARSLIEGSAKLTELAVRFNVEVGRAHHAFDDAYMLAGVVPALNELRIRRARKIAAVNLLDQLGLALALTEPTTGDDEESLFRDITRPFTLGRYSDCLENYAAELTRTPGAPSLEQVVQRLGGRSLMERLRAERTAAERYPIAVERLRVLVQSSTGETVAHQIDDLLSRAALSTSQGADTHPNRVNLLTLHSTKGLEFSRVYIVGVEDQQLPGWKALEENAEDEIQEARRLLYVGMTRAKDRLVLTRAGRRSGLPTGGSLFIAEAGLPTSESGIPPALAIPVTPR